jgi:omega-hydroxy-beta-dihydromenaquinone-9 sulfotransferase
MSWRDWLYLWFGPSILGGITFGDWWALLRENHFSVDRAYWLRAATITFGSMGNSLARRFEQAAYGRKVAEVNVEPPLFVLGIWRSGTTHLQNLLAVDDRFAFPNWYQVSSPHTFLSTEATVARLAGFFVPRKRFQDNMRIGFTLPAEDEFALCIATARSAYLSWVFPRRAEHYDRYLTFRQVPEAVVAEWKAALLWFVSKITLKYGKPVALKSPAHTGRIRLLLDVFPGARFVHIHRDPYTVFQSACHMTRELMTYWRLQNSDFDVEGVTIHDCKELFEAFFEEKDLIPEGRFHEVRFEDLERDPIGQMRGVYESLGLPDFGAVEPAMRRYVESQSAYRKNDYPGLAPDLKERIAREWSRCFDAWGYPV